MDAINNASTMTLLVLTGVAVVMDFIRMKISNRLILLGLLLAILFQIWKSGIEGLIPCLGNIVFPVVVYYLFYLIGVLGAGDIKLFSVIGGFINFRQFMQCMLVSFLLGAIVSFCKMFFSKTLRSGMISVGQYFRALSMGEYRRYTPESKKQTIHFSLYILLGLILSYDLPR